ncbi:hypothetical protein ETAA8_52390 [Anatilimnocola aggregata]|uniref:Uncharacterized protein n=2 Tax=Anatilimnocola aggregata TaxID=2528021 RepID=A0A517YIR9_9BACT|nr:hypothetical protein ETAA8_52390 [Anatilimnocola aggregata]
MRACRTLSLLLLLTLLCPLGRGDAPAGAAVAAQTRPVSLRRAPEGERAGDRQREGTKLTDVTGRFELAGDRITFYPSSGRETYRVLENLSLERVGQVLSESRARQEWTVSGVLTEFRGTNYLLLSKAVVKSAVDPR